MLIFPFLHAKSTVILQQLVATLIKKNLQEEPTIIINVLSTQCIRSEVDSLVSHRGDKNTPSFLTVCL